VEQGEDCDVVTACEGKGGSGVRFVVAQHNAGPLAQFAKVHLGVKMFFKRRENPSLCGKSFGRDTQIVEPV